MINRNLDDFISEGKEIYVKNNASTPGMLLINFTEPASGKTVMVKIPNTFLPIRLSDFVTPNMIANSYDLRSWLKKGILTLVDPEEAKDIVNDPENQYEIERLFTSDLSKDKTAYNSELHKLFTKNASSVHVPEEYQEEEEEEIGNSITPRVLSFVERILSKDLNVHKGLNELRVMEKQKQLTIDDCDYIINELEDGQIKNLVTKIRASFVESPEEDVVEEATEGKRKRGRPRKND